MKKIIALLLSVLMMMSVLAACGEKDDDKDETKGKKETVSVTPATQGQGSAEPAPSVPAPSEPAPTEPTPPAPQTGVILNAPEVDFDDTIPEIRVTMVLGGAQTMTVAIVADGVQNLIYAEGDGVQEVIEVTAAGAVIYMKQAGDAAFQLVDASLEEIQAEADNILQGMQMAMLISPDFQSIQYRTTGQTANGPKGPAIVYDLIENGQPSGQIWIDQATGLGVNFIDPNGNEVLKVTDFSVTSAGIPAYK